MEEITNESLSRLWVAVLMQAYKDLKSPSPSVKSSAKTWFVSNRMDVGSYKNICLMFSLNKKKMSKLLENEGLLGNG